MKRLSKVKADWNPKFAYAIGLLATDGNLSKDGRHINMTSKDEQLILMFKDCLKLGNKVGMKARGGEKEKKYFVIQFGDITFYEFLMGIGLTPAKSKTLGQLSIPQEYFWDFLRGCIDGDGTIGVFKHPESIQPQLRVRLYSASLKFITWLKEEISELSDLEGGWIEDSIKSSRVYKLSFGKQDSIKLLRLIYNQDCCLSRKYEPVKYLFKN